MTVEHHLPRSAEPALRNSYANCLYACRLCNSARGRKPVASDRGTLLDPTAVAWSEHFVADGSTLTPREGDKDAAHTHEAYDLDDPRKCDRRAHRQEIIDDKRGDLEMNAGRIESLLRWMDDPAGDSECVILLGIAETLRKQMRGAARDLARFAAIPVDAPSECRCGSTAGHGLPQYLQEQTWKPVVDLS